MTSLHHQLRRNYRQLAARPVPEAWTDRHMVLRSYATVADLVAAIRDHHRPDCADDTVRALADLARHDNDATAVLLEALVWHLHSVTGPGTTTEFRDDLLVDLVFVIHDSGDLDRVNRLPKPLARRAYARARRRTEGERLYYERTARLSEAGLSEDPAEIATDRAHLHAIHQTVQEHIERGAITQAMWDDYRDGRLAPAMGWWRTQPDRTRTYRARRAIEAVLPHAS